MFLHGTQTVNEEGHLEIGGVDVTEIVAEYSTPTIVYDMALFERRAKGFVDTFEQLGVKAQVAYASKAFSNIALYQVAETLGLSLDVVSEGELYTAVRANFPAERIHFHGNNKSESELRYAFEVGIGCIVIDNFYEIDLLRKIATERNQKMNVLIRVTPGVEASTHDYITTGQEDSKFGFDLKNGQADRAFQQLKEDKHLQFLGMHCHIGSQIFEVDGFVHAAEALMQKMHTWQEEDHFICSVLNLGGGFGIRYTEEDAPEEPHVYVKAMTEAVMKLAEQYEYPMPAIWIEPGRSLVGDAGTTLYTVGSQKEVPNVRQYVAVDGGMTDNIRPALYDARYEAVVANKMNAPKDTVVTIAGKCCESGDQLIQDARISAVEDGDIIALFCTGAYTYAMASNYNRLAKPAVVFTKDGRHQLVARREKLEDLVRLDEALPQNWLEERN